MKKTNTLSIKDLRNAVKKIKRAERWGRIITAWKVLTSKIIVITFQPQPKEGEE